MRSPFFRRSNEVLHRRRVHRRAVVEGDAVGEVEGVGELVVRDLPIAGQQADDLGRAGSILDQSLVDAIDGAEAADLEGIVGVERADVGEIRHAEHGFLRGGRQDEGGGKRGPHQRGGKRAAPAAAPGRYGHVQTPTVGVLVGIGR